MKFSYLFGFLEMWKVQLKELIKRTLFYFYNKAVGNNEEI